MQAEFMARVYTVVLRLALRLFAGNGHRVQNAVGNAWYMYQQTPRRLEVTASSFAWAACRWEMSARDLPGTGRSGYRSDALDRPDTWTAGSMELLLDRGPGPEQIAQYREILNIVTEEADDEMRFIIREWLAGRQNKDIAAALGITGGALTQRRQRLIGPYLD